MLWFFLSVIAAPAYIALGIGTANLMVKLGFGDSIFPRKVGPLAISCGAFWPLAVPVLFFYYSPMIVAKGFSWLGRRVKESEGLLAPGIPKPSHVLEGLVAARILQNYTKIQRSHGSCLYYEGEIRVDARVRDGVLYGVVFQVKGESFQANSKGPLVDALKRAMVLKEEHEKNAELAKQENSALNAIEFLTIGDKTDA